MIVNEQDIRDGVARIPRHMRRAYTFDFGAKSLYVTCGLHWIVRAVFFASAWLPRVVYRTATTDLRGRRMDR
jgi:hypothetical protein